MTDDRPAPDRVMRLIDGYWNTAVIAAAAAHSVFNHLEDGAGTAAEVAARARISPRGAQALLDGLLSIDLVTLDAGRYSNTPEASAYLVDGRTGCLAGFAKLKLSHTGSVTDLAEVVRAGGPLKPPETEKADNPHWENIVPAIAPVSVPAATAARDVLGIADAGEITILDVGGGSGIYSSLWLSANPAAHADQLDWDPINAIARRLVDDTGVGDRFTTLNGDFHTTDFGTARYDIAVYSHIAHQESAESNIDVFTRLRKALRPGGALVVSDYIVEDDRSGPALPLLFALEMLLKSRTGCTWRRRDYRDWLTAAGFEDITFHAAPPATMVIAR